MTLLHRREVLLPTARQDLLLKACLLDDGDAIVAWRNWRKSIDLDSIDAGSIRLLPMLAARLQNLGVDDPDFGRYRGVQRRTWARNRLLFRGAGRILTAMNATDIPVMALKGLVLAGTYYPVESTRWMGDVDLLVRRADALRAVDLLDRIGWHASLNRPTRIAHLAIHHARPFRDPTTAEVEADLHWTIMYGRYSDEAEAATWDRADPIEIEGAKAVAPCAADLLVHVCVHGLRWNDLPPVRWVVDAAMLIRSGKVDWGHVRDQALRWGVGLPLGHAFAYLHEQLRLDIPAEVRGAMQSAPVTSEQRFLFEVEQRPAVENRLIDVIRLHASVARNERKLHGDKLGYFGYFNALREWHSLPRMLRWQWSRIAGVGGRRPG
jgi:hypothetical protein